MAIANSRILEELRTRVANVLEARSENFIPELKIFFSYVHKSLLLNSILNELEQYPFDFDDYVNRLPGQCQYILYPDRYEEKISLCLGVICRLMEKQWSISYFINIVKSNSYDSIVREISRLYFIPLADYFEEKVNGCNYTLYLLTRYKLRTEWFQKQKLLDLYCSDTQRGEDNLTADLQEYLHSSGIDYPFSTPLSPSGRTDLAGLLNSDDPLVLEVKLFNLDCSYDKGYIRKGLNQAYRYAQDYGKSIGYLMIFNLDPKIIEFEGDEVIKTIVIGNTTIYIIVVDVFHNELTASKMKKPDIYQIEDSYLKSTDS